MPWMPPTHGESMLMPWFLPLATVVGVLSTRGALAQRAFGRGSRQAPGLWLLIVLGWMPLLVWLTNNLWPQY